MGKQRIKPNYLRLADLDHRKLAVLNSLGSPASRRVYEYAINLPGAILTAPTSINSKGVIVGVYNDANFANHGFLRSRDGTFTTFDPPGSTDTSPYAINSAGRITGVVNGRHGLLRIDDKGEEVTSYEYGR